LNNDEKKTFATLNADEAGDALQYLDGIDPKILAQAIAQNRTPQSLQMEAELARMENGESLLHARSQAEVISYDDEVLVNYTRNPLSKQNISVK
jgi:hypothetical protein